MRTSADRPALPSVGALTGAVLLADVLTKRVAERRFDEPVDLLLGARLELSFNSGVAFGALAGAPEIVVLALIAVCVGLLVTATLRGWVPAGGVATGMLAGGAVANLVDRLPDGRVTDFIVLPRWPSFNVADIAITAAIAALLLTSLRPDRAERAPAPGDRPRGDPSVNAS